MKPTLIAYSTTDGHTLRIAERLQTFLLNQQLPVQLMPVREAHDLDLSSFGVLVVGASIRYGRHQQEVFRFIEKHGAALQGQPSVFFSVNVVARKPAKRTAQTNPYVRKFLGQIAWKPHHVAIFAGKIDYPRYGWLDRQVIRLIMMMTKGPTDVRSCTEFTDWDQVDALAREVAARQRAWAGEAVLSAAADGAAAACPTQPR